MKSQAVVVQTLTVSDYPKEKISNREKLIVFTDGYPFGSWGDDTYCDTLWVIQ